MRTSKRESKPRRRRGGSGEGSQPRPPTTPPSQLPSVRHQAGRLPWAERFKNRPPADASGELFRRTPLDPTSPLPPRAGLFLVCSVLARACFEENALRRHYEPPLIPRQGRPPNTSGTRKQTTRYPTPLNRLFQPRETPLAYRMAAQTRFIALGEGPRNAYAASVVRQAASVNPLSPGAYRLPLGPISVGDPGPGLGAAPPVLGAFSPRQYAKAGGARKCNRGFRRLTQIIP